MNVDLYICKNNFHQKHNSSRISLQLSLYYFLPLQLPLITSFSFSPINIHRLLVFSSTVVKHRLLGNSSGLNLNSTLLETSSEPRSRALEESHRTLTVISWSTWIWLRRQAEERGSFSKEPKRAKKKNGSQRPKNFKTFHCHVGHPVLLWVPRGSHFTSQVCCRTWFCKTMQCCAVERILDLEPGATARRLTLIPTGGNSVLIISQWTFTFASRKLRSWTK